MTINIPESADGSKLEAVATRDKIDATDEQEEQEEGEAEEEHQLVDMLWDRWSKDCQSAVRLADSLILAAHWRQEASVAWNESESLREQLREKQQQLDFLMESYNVDSTPASAEREREKEQESEKPEHEELERQRSKYAACIARQEPASRAVNNLPILERQADQQHKQQLLRRRATIAFRRQTRRMDNLEVMNKMTGVLNQVQTMERTLIRGAEEYELVQAKNNQLQQALHSIERKQFHSESYLRQLVAAMRNLMHKTELILKQLNDYDGGAVERAVKSLLEAEQVVRNDLLKQLVLISDDGNCLTLADENIRATTTNYNNNSNNDETINNRPPQNSSHNSSTISDLLREIRENKRDRLKKIGSGESGASTDSKRRCSTQTLSNTVKNIQQTLKYAIEKHRQSILNDDEEDEDEDFFFDDDDDIDLVS